MEMRVEMGEGVMVNEEAEGGVAKKWIRKNGEGRGGRREMRVFMSGFVAKVVFHNME